jgi:hypothetical protein
MYQHTYAHKLHTITITNYPYTWTLLHVSRINHHPQRDINKKAYILLKHQMYVHNVEIYKSSYKYNNVANMDSMMLSCFWLKFISMPLFTVCVVIHTQTDSIAFFGLEGSKPCAFTDVSCMTNTKESSFAEKKISKDWQTCHVVINTMWANCILGVICFLASCF